MKNATIERGEMKRLEACFFNAMDVLRIHKNTKWFEVDGRVEDGDDGYVTQKQILSGFMFEKIYAINPDYEHAEERYGDETLEVEERKFIDDNGEVFFDYSVAETQLDVYISGNVEMNLRIRRVSEKHNQATIAVSLTDQRTGSKSNCDIIIDFDTFKLRSREIGKVRREITDAFTQEEQLLQKIEKNKIRIADYEKQMECLHGEIADLTAKHASFSSMMGNA